MKQFTYICPFCNQKLECDYTLNNTSCECPMCHHEVIPAINNNLNYDIYKIIIKYSKTKIKEYHFNFNKHNIHIINENKITFDNPIIKFDMQKILFPSFTITTKLNCSFYKNNTVITEKQFLYIYFQYIFETNKCIKLNSGSVFTAELCLYSNYITLSHGGLNILTEMGIQGEKYIPFKSITAIQIKPVRWLTFGYIQFSIKGEVGSKKGLFAAMGDENTIRLTNEYEYYLADFIRNYIFQYITKE